MIETLIGVLEKAGLELSAQDLADALWLAGFIDAPAAIDLASVETKPREDAASTPGKPSTADETRQDGRSDPAGAPADPAADLLLPGQGDDETAGQGAGGLPFRSPTGRALPGPLEIERALRPLMRRVPSRVRFLLDEEATVERIADEDNWVPVLRPAPSRWLDLALVVDDSPSMAIWRQTITELGHLLEHHGAFRTVQTWGFAAGKEEGALRLYKGFGSKTPQAADVRELVDASGRRLILLLSDCVAPYWQSSRIAGALRAWGQLGLVAIVQVLPQTMWLRSGLRLTVPVALRSSGPGTPNHDLRVHYTRPRDRLRPPAGLAVPVATLEPRLLIPWAQSLAGMGQVWVPGVLYPVDFPSTSNRDDALRAAAAAPTARQLVDDFRGTASPIAWQLAGYLAAAPLSLPVMRLIQRAMLPGSRQVHLAEVFLSGLFQRDPASALAAHPDDVRYEFAPGVRDLLLSSVYISDAVDVMASVSDYIAQQTGSGFNFRAMLADPTTAGQHDSSGNGLPFASVTSHVLRRLGGRYTEAALRLEQSPAAKTAPTEEPSGAAASDTEQSTDAGITSDERPSDASAALKDELVDQATRLSSTVLRQLHGHSASVFSAAFSPDGGYLVTASADKTARIWNAGTGQEVRQLIGHTAQVHSAAYHPDGQQIVTASADYTARIWDARTGQNLNTLIGHTFGVNSAAYSPSAEHIVTASADSTIKMWDAKSGKVLRSLTGHTDSVNSATFSPDGARIVTAGADRTIKMWDAKSGRELRTLTGHTDSVNSAAFSPDGRLIVTASADDTVQIWDAGSGVNLRHLTGHTDSVNSAAFSPDGRLIVTASADKSIKMWDAASGAELRTLTGHTAMVRSAAFSLDSRHVISASEDHTVRLWDVATGAEPRYVQSQLVNAIDRQTINSGLGTPAKLKQVPEVRTTLATFHADFTVTSQQIDVLGDYMDVHDNLHQLEFLCYNSIVALIGRFPGDVDAVDIITDHEITFQAIVVRLQEVAARPALSGDEMTWIQNLVQAQGYLRQAIETLDPVPLKRSSLLMRRVLDRYPSLITARISSAARNMRIEGIVQAMTAIQQVLRDIGLEPTEAQAFERSVSSLTDLNGRLTALVRDFGRWQDVDVQFRGIEAGIDRDLEILEISWSDLQARIAPLAADESQDWVQSLRRSAVALDGGLTSHDPVKIRSSFSRYRRIASERFFQVSTELKDLCGQLREILTPLAALGDMLTVGKSEPFPVEESRPQADASGSADNRVRLEGQLVEQDRRYTALTDQIAVLDQDIGRALNSDEKLNLKQRRDARDAERSAVSKKMSEIETQLTSLAAR